MPDALLPAPHGLPEKPTIDGLEGAWIERWEDEETYRFDRGATREHVYSIDTPPPTVSGSLHIGHVFSYTQADVIARYQRMTRQERLLSHGLGRQRVAHGAARRELLRGAL